MILAISVPAGPIDYVKLACLVHAAAIHVSFLITVTHVNNMSSLPLVRAPGHCAS